MQMDGIRDVPDCMPASATEMETT